MADALDSKSSPSNRVSVQVRSPVLLNTKGLTVVYRESFLAFKNSEFLFHGSGMSLLGFGEMFNR